MRELKVLVNPEGEIMSLDGFCLEEINTVVATRTFTSVKPSISPSNFAQNANPGTVLKTARPEDSKTPTTC